MHGDCVEQQQLYLCVKRKRHTGGGSGEHGRNDITDRDGYSGYGDDPANTGCIGIDPGTNGRTGCSDFCGSDSDANRYSGSNDDPGADRHTDPGSDSDTDGYSGNDNDSVADRYSGNNIDSGADGCAGNDNNSGTDGYPGSNPDTDSGTGERNFRYCTADRDTDAD